MVAVFSGGRCCFRRHHETLRHRLHRYAIHHRRHHLLHHPKDGSQIHRPGCSAEPVASNDLVAAGSGLRAAEQAARACTSAPARACTSVPAPDDTSRGGICAGRFISPGCVGSGRGRLCGLLRHRSVHVVTRPGRLCWFLRHRSVHVVTGPAGSHRPFVLRRPLILRLRLISTRR